MQCMRLDLNQGPLECESSALTPELRVHTMDYISHFTLLGKVDILKQRYENL